MSTVVVAELLAAAPSECTDELTDAKKALKRAFYTRIIARLLGF